MDKLSEVDGPMSVEVIHALADARDLDGPLSIAEVAEYLDISAHTLRYSERAGLVSVGRDSKGNRVYDADAVGRLVFLSRMRLSGMAMRDLQHYIKLVEAGD